MPPIPKPFQQGGTPLSDAQQKIQTWVDLVRSSLPESMVKTMGEMVLGMVPDPNDPQMADLTVPLMAPVVGVASRGALRAARKAGTLGQAAMKGAEEGTLGAALHRIPNPIAAHHGSPHDFPPVRHIEMPDGTRLYQNMLEQPNTPAGAKVLREYPLGRFDMSKIGTGEGAQAYGHGLYFAEKEGTANAYRKELSGRTANYLGKDGEMVDGGTTWQKAADAASGAGFHPDIGRGIASQVQQWVDDGKSAATYLRFHNVPEQYQPAYKAAADAWGSVKRNPGRMYEVNLHVTPDELLDWDKPLSEQPQKVREALEAKGIREKTPDEQFAAKYEMAKTFYEKPFHHLNAIEQQEVLRAVEANKITKGAEAYRKAGKDATAEQASAILKDAGIKGIQYLDQGSRAAGTGTRNFVIFDDQLIEIKRKFGFATTAAAAEWVRQNGGVVQSRDE
jgi:hypothetical protein